MYSFLPLSMLLLTLVGWAGLSFVGTVLRPAVSRPSITGNLGATRNSLKGTSEHERC